MNEIVTVVVAATPTQSASVKDVSGVVAAHALTGDAMSYILVNVAACGIVHTKDVVPAAIVLTAKVAVSVNSPPTFISTDLSTVTPVVAGVPVIFALTELIGIDGLFVTV